MARNEAAEQLCHAAGMYEQAERRATDDNADEVDVANLEEAESILADQATRFLRSRG